MLVKKHFGGLTSIRVSKFSSNVELVVVGTRMGYVWVIDHLCFVDNEDVDNGNDTTEEEE